MADTPYIPIQPNLATVDPSQYGPQLSLDSIVSASQQAKGLGMHNAEDAQKLLDMVQVAPKQRQAEASKYDEIVKRIQQLGPIQRASAAQELQNKLAIASAPSAVEAGTSANAALAAQNLVSQLKSQQTAEGVMPTPEAQAQRNAGVQLAGDWAALHGSCVPPPNDAQGIRNFANEQAIRAGQLKAAGTLATYGGDVTPFLGDHSTVPYEGSTASALRQQVVQGIAGEDDPAAIEAAGRSYTMAAVMNSEFWNDYRAEGEKLVAQIKADEEIKDHTNVEAAHAGLIRNLDPQAIATAPKDEAALNELKQMISAHVTAKNSNLIGEEPRSFIDKINTWIAQATKGTLMDDTRRQQIRQVADNIALASLDSVGSTLEQYEHFAKYNPAVLSHMPGWTVDAILDKKQRGWLSAYRLKKGQTAEAPAAPAAVPPGSSPHLRKFINGQWYRKEVVNGVPRVVPDVAPPVPATAPPVTSAPVNAAAPSVTSAPVNAAAPSLFDIPGITPQAILPDAAARFRL